MSFQRSSPEPLPREAVYGIGMGIFFMAFFGAMWGFLAVSFTNGSLQLAGYLTIGLVTLALLGAVMRVLRYARSLPEISLPEEAGEGKRISIYFGIVFGLEFALIAVVAIALGRAHLQQLIPPAVALIVGIHFFPLARLFRVSMYWLTGGLLCILAAVALAALLPGRLVTSLTGQDAKSWDLFIAAGAALVIWGTGFYGAWHGLRVVKGLS